VHVSKGRIDRLGNSIRDGSMSEEHCRFVSDRFKIIDRRTTPSEIRRKLKIQKILINQLQKGPG